MPLPSFPSRHPILFVFATFVVVLAPLGAVFKFRHHHAEGLAQAACDSAKPGATFAAWRASGVEKAREQGARIIEWNQHGEQGVILSFTAVLLDRYECGVFAREGVIQRAEVGFHD
jgi:hypothetical protein